MIIELQSKLISKFLPLPILLTIFYYFFLLYFKINMLESQAKYKLATLASSQARVSSNANDPSHHF